MVPTLEERMAALEAEVERLKRQQVPQDVEPTRWWKPFIGAFENDALFEEAVRLGREYRESLRPSEDSTGEDGT